LWLAIAQVIPSGPATKNTIPTTDIISLRAILPIIEVDAKANTPIIKEVIAAAR
tara:strand:- start:820 stop:981 length:162 start_codon:yes stop_codon:yes gene_type:complete